MAKKKTQRKRAPKGTTFMIHRVQKKVKDRFKAACAVEGKSMYKVVTDFFVTHAEEILGQK